MGPKETKGPKASLASAIPLTSLASGVVFVVGCGLWARLNQGPRTASLPWSSFSDSKRPLRASERAIRSASAQGNSKRHLLDHDLASDRPIPGGS